MWGKKKVWVRGGGAGLGTAVVQEENMSERLEKDERVVEREVKEGGCALVCVCVKERVSVSPPTPQSTRPLPGRPLHHGSYLIASFRKV